MQLRSEDVDFLVYILGCSLGNFILTTLIGSFLDRIPSFWSFVPGRRSFCCIGSIVAFLCEGVCLPTCLTG